LEVDEAGAAQESEPEDRAQILSDSARTALDEGRIADARRLLAESLALSRRSATAINLAQVHRVLGEPTAALEILETLLEGDYGEVTPEIRQGATRFRAEVLLLIASLEISIDGAPQANSRIDSGPVSIIQRGAVFRAQLDPGAHHVEVEWEERRREANPILAEGETTRINLRLSDPVMEGGEPPATREEDGGLLSSPWFWIVGGVVVAGLAVGTTVLIASGDSGVDDDPQGIFPIVEALR